MIVFGQKRLHLDKVVVFGQSGCIRAKVVVFGQRWLYSDKVVVFRQKLLFSGKVFVLGQKWLYSDKSGYIPQSGCKCAKWLISGKMVFKWAR